MKPFQSADIEFDDENNEQKVDFNIPNAVEKANDQEDFEAEPVIEEIVPV